MQLERGDKIGVITSGGDAPGMNAAVRAAVRVGMDLGLEIVGIQDGFDGLMDAHAIPLVLRDVDEGARRGGTILGTARSRAFPSPEGQKRARESIAKLGLVGVMVIGGNGSLTGAHTLAGIETVRGPLLIAGIPASIDNDIGCTSMSIGVDTAMNTIVDACDRILDTATSHRRTFIVEVMGRDCGYLAMTAGIASGADAVLVREHGKDEDAVVGQVVKMIERAYAGSDARRRVLVLKAEGVKIDTARLKERIDKEVMKRLPDIDTRVTVLGHVVRGGSPTAFDRLLGARLANSAMRALADRNTDFMAGWVGPGVMHEACKYDPYVVLSPLADMITETAKLLRGESPLAQWRKRVYREVETILDR